MAEPGILNSFYLWASARGWAGKGKKSSIPELPRAKAIVIEIEGVRYVDHYFVSVWGQQSFGQTVLWLQAEKPGSETVLWTPVWGMQYGGQYPANVIPFLKTALSTAYEKREFIGGRGPLEFRQGDLVYLNHPEVNEFADFRGSEEILKNGVQVGFHWYRGLSLL